MLDAGYRMLHAARWTLEAGAVAVAVADTGSLTSCCECPDKNLTPINYIYRAAVWSE
jgi:hypothetical protein